MTLGVVISPSNSTTSTTHPIGAVILKNKEDVPFPRMAFYRPLSHFAIALDRALLTEPLPYSGLIIGMLAVR